MVRQRTVRGVPGVAEMTFEEYNRHMAQASRAAAAAAAPAPAPAPVETPAAPQAALAQTLPQQEKIKRAPNAWAAAASAYYHKEKARRPDLTYKMALQELKKHAPK